MARQLKISTYTKHKSGGQKLKSTNKQPHHHHHDDDPTSSPTSICSSNVSSVSSMSFEVDNGSNSATFDDNKTPLDITVISDYRYSDAEPDIVREDKDDSAVCMYGNEVAATTLTTRSPCPVVERKTLRRSSMKQSGDDNEPRRSSIQFSGVNDITLPNTGTKVQRKTVSFNERVQVKNVPRVKDLTNQPEKIWFQDDEYDAMKERCYHLLDKVERGVLPLEIKSKLCLRGLEGMMSEQSKQQTAVRCLVWNVALDEQDRQIDMDTFDDQSMANALKLCTIRSRIEATNRAKQDEKDVQKYLSSTRRKCRLSPVLLKRKKECAN